MKKITVTLRISLLFSLLFCFGIKANSQSKEHIDSLIEHLKRIPDDTNKLHILDTIVDNAADGVWQKYNEQMADLSRKLSASNNASIKLAGKNFLAVSNLNLGVDFGEKGDYNKALFYYNDCTKILEEIGDKKNLGNAISNIGAIYARDGDPEKALENYNRAINLEEETNDFPDLFSSLSNAGSVYFDNNNFDSALIYFNRSLNVAEEHKINSPDVPILFKNLGNVMERKGDHKKALEYYNKGLKVADEKGYKLGKTVNLIGISEVYFDNGELTKSRDYAKQALNLSIQTSNLKNIDSASSVLTRINKKTGNFKDALEMYELEVMTRDSLSKELNHKAVMRHQFQYAFDKKQDSTRAEQAKIDAVKAKELENQKRIRNFIFGGLMIVVFFLILVFRQRNKIAKEKQRSEELLLNILPVDVAEELKNTGEAKVKSFEHVTVLFTDFKGFTQISEKLTPEQLVSEIDYCFRGFDNIIHKHGIEKIKTIGDSYMCAGGVPKANTTHPEDVVNAAIEIRDFVMQHKKDREARGEIPFEVRIGVNTGPVVAGIVGVKKFAYDIWGDAVNLASRMESSGVPGKVNISGNTFELVKDKFKCEHRGKVMAKGKGDMDMYFVEKP
jgi:adenylate cyclase